MIKTKLWVLASRPKTLLASISPVLIGSAFAFRESKFTFWIFLCTMLFGIFIQVGTNLANDYFDAQKGADNKNRKGPVRVTQAGLIPPNRVRLAFIITFLAALLIAIPLAIVGGPLIWIFMVLSITFGYLYTGGPIPLAYIGLGEVFVLIFFGPVACLGSYYLQTLSWNFQVFSLGMGLGLISTALLVVNNLRDIDEDEKAGKKTLAVRFGKGFAKAEYIFCITCGFAISLSFLTPVFWIIVIPMLPLFSRLFKEIHNYTAFQLNATLAKTSALIALYTIIAILGS